MYVCVILMHTKQIRLQAMRMRSLGWDQYLKVELVNGNKTLSVSYWV